MRRIIFFLGGLFVLFNINAVNDLDLNAILSKMTLEEKIGQLNQLNARTDIEGLKEEIKAGKVGSLLNVDSKYIDELQKIAIKKSRLGIPLIFARDVIHGYKTIFPIPLGQAASFDPFLVKECAEIAAKEAASVGIRWTFAPMIDISRDPRWGRIAESFGEDTYLTSLLGSYMTKGFQGKDLSSPYSIAACAKHFVGYGAGEGGRDYNSTNIPDRLLRNVYLPPFKKQVDIGVASFMPSFNDNDGVPMTGNKYTNVSILRDDWKYEGVVVSDWAAIKEMINHGFASNLKDAAFKAINGGVDIDMMSLAYTKELESLVKSNPDLLKLIDKSVMRVLELKKKLGLFDNPYTTVKKDVLYAPEHLAIAKKAAEESIVLLKNNSFVLPINEKVKNIAIIGPLADAPQDQLGTWVFDGDKERTITPLNALERVYGKRVKFHYLQTLQNSCDNSIKDFKIALSAAKKCDLVLVFVGEESMLSGEAHCLANINLIGAQSQLVDEMTKSGKPVVLVVMAGRPLTIEREFKKCDAVLYVWHPGTMGGEAIADILFGKVNPSGKLPVTFPRYVGQIPIYYNHNNTGRPAPENVKTLEQIKEFEPQTSLGNTSFYMDYGNHPFLPFGYGLSYTSFEYKDLIISKENMTSHNDSIVVQCSLKNTGSFAGTDVVQLYIQDIVGSITRPIKELKRFERVELLPGEEKRVRFVLYSDDFAFWGLDNNKAVEAGEIKLWIGESSQKGLMKHFEIIN